MFSDVVHAALQREFVGQPRAVNSVVRGVTRLVSGLTPRERPLCAYLFTGPTGTGKTHLIESLAKILHGDSSRVVAVDCTQAFPGEAWTGFAAQLAPLYTRSWPPLGPAGPVEPPPLSILRIESLERAPRDVAKALAAALETGQVTLPDGRRGGLRNVLVFITSSLGAKEILDDVASIGFSGTPADEEAAEDNRVYRTCVEQAQQQFGGELVGRLDGLIVFHRLSAEHLDAILERRLQRLNAWLAGRGFRCELDAAARGFLLERGQRDLKLGAWNLVRAHRRHVEFPVADLMVSGQTPRGSVVRIGREDGVEHLHFTVESAALAEAPAGAVREVPVSWDEPGLQERMMPGPAAPPS